MDPTTQQPSPDEQIKTASPETEIQHSAQTIPPTKKSKKPIIVMSVLVAFLLVAGVYFMIAKPTAKKSSVSSTSCGTANCDLLLKDAPADKVISDIKNQASSSKLKDGGDKGVAYVDISTSAIPGMTFIASSVSAAFTYQDTFDFSNSKGKENDKTYCQLVHTDLAPIGTFIGKAFESAGFKRTDKGDVFRSYQYQDCSDAFIEIRNNDYCSVIVNVGQTEVACGDNSKIADKTKQALEVADSLNANYLSQHPTTKISRNIIASFEIKASKTPGYEIIPGYTLEVAVQDLYRKTGTTTWTVIDENVTTGENTCHLFTGEAKLAFKGEKCWVSKDKEQTI